jgi:hypothetical protein
MNKRKELYAIIVTNDLQDMVKSIFGRNYTQVSNDNLDAFIRDYCHPVCEDQECDNCCNESLIRLVEVLYKKRILLKSEYDYIMMA